MDGVIAKRDVGNGEVVKTIGEFRLLKRLCANVRVGIKRLGDARGQRINLNAGDSRAAEHFSGHEADEVADAAGGFEHAPAVEAEPLGGAIHRADDGRRGVMGVEGGGAGGTMLFIGQDFRKLDLLLAPVRAVHVEDLGHRAPADVFDERGFFLVCGRAFLGIQRPQRFDRLEVLLKLLLRSAVAQPVGLGDAVVVEILRRFFLMTRAVWLFFGREQDVFLPHHFPRLRLRLLRRFSLLHQFHAQRGHFVLRLFLRLQQHLVQESFPFQVAHHLRTVFAPVFLGHPAVLGQVLSFFGLWVEKRSSCWSEGIWWCRIAIVY